MQKIEPSGGMTGMRTRKEKLCVCCPFCGKLHDKSSRTESEIVCVRCSRKYVAIVEDSRVTTFPAKRSTDRNLTA